MSSAYNPQSNGRAEFAVKSMKRLIEDNIGPDGELDTDTFLRATLIKRNTPDPTSKLSPAEVVFGRKLRDTMPRINKDINIFYNDDVRPSWTKAWEEKEMALRTRYQGCMKRLFEHSKNLPCLETGDRVSLQNQTGNKPAKWDRTGTIVEVRDFDKYVIKVDGSGRLTLRNRRYLRKVYKDKGLYGSQPIRMVPPIVTNEKAVPSAQHIPVQCSQTRPTTPSVDDPGHARNSVQVQRGYGTQSPSLLSVPCPSSALESPLVPYSPVTPSSTPKLTQQSEVIPSSTPQLITYHDTTSNPSLPLTECPTPHRSSPISARNIKEQLFTDVKTTVANRPVRNKVERLFYDANKGEYTSRHPGCSME